jgi:hypothetical protein
MATSTNYLWAEPNDSDLVKNGALAIRTLGNAIDSSVWNIGYGQAGKNKIINGDCRIAQRGSTVTSPSTAYFYGAVDRFLGYSSANSTATVSQEAFTPGTAPASPYESQFFVRSASTSTATYLATRIEDVRTFAGQTVSISFYAKTDSAQTLSAISLEQNFGSGGSASVSTASALTPALTTSWQRFTGTIAIPSISGKTIGSGSYLQIQWQGAVNKTIDMWGVQLEYGSTATPFQTASGGSYQGELAACQRYYWRNTAGDSSTHFSAAMGASSTTEVDLIMLFPVTMRIRPTSLDYSLILTYDGTSTYSSGTFALITGRSGVNTATVRYTHGSAALTQYRPYQIAANSNSNAYIGFSAEL